MKSIKLALLMVVLCGTLFACKQPEAPVPAEEISPPPMVSAPAPAPPMAADPMLSEPAITEGTFEEDMDEDSPHSGGDKIGTGGGTVPEK